MEEGMETKDEEIQEKVAKVLPKISLTISLKTKMYYYFCLWRNLIFTVPTLIRSIFCNLF
jgi:hypothetical protein